MRRIAGQVRRGTALLDLEVLEDRQLPSGMNLAPPPTPAVPDPGGDMTPALIQPDATPGDGTSPTGTPDPDGDTDETYPEPPTNSAGGADPSTQTPGTYPSDPTADGKGTPGISGPPTGQPASYPPGATAVSGGSGASTAGVNPQGEYSYNPPAYSRYSTPETRGRPSSSSERSADESYERKPASRDASQSQVLASMVPGQTPSGQPVLPAVQPPAVHEAPPVPPSGDRAPPGGVLPAAALSGASAAADPPAPPSAAVARPEGEEPANEAAQPPLTGPEEPGPLGLEMHGLVQGAWPLNLPALKLGVDHFFARLEDLAGEVAVLPSSLTLRDWLIASAVLSGAVAFARRRFGRRGLDVLSAWETIPDSYWASLPVVTHLPFEDEP